MSGRSGLRVMTLVNCWMDGGILCSMVGGWVDGVTGDALCLPATRFCQRVFIPTAKRFVTGDPCVVSVESIEPTL